MPAASKSLPSNCLKLRRTLQSPYVVETCDLLADVRYLDFRRENKQQPRREAIENLDRQIVDDWLRGEKLGNQSLLELRSKTRESLKRISYALLLRGTYSACYLHLAE